jgi:hypothetical protein
MSIQENTTTMEEHICSVSQRRLINAEYQRGFMEGQHQAVVELAACIDRILGRYNHIAQAERLVENEQ